VHEAAWTLATIFRAIKTGSTQAIRNEGISNTNPHFNPLRLKGVFRSRYGEGGCPALSFTAYGTLSLLRQSNSDRATRSAAAIGPRLTRQWALLPETRRGGPALYPLRP
jgi:hypothetical protein